MSEYKKITPCELKNMMDCSAVRLVDVRNPDEFEAKHVKGAELVPLPQLCSQASSWDKKESIFVVCQQGPRSGEAQEKLINMGFQDVTMIDGGTARCVREGLDIVHGQKRLSVQRQTFIVIGLMVLTGLAIAQFGSRWGLILPLFAGCGLVMAGISGFCPLAILIEKMPWNSRGTRQAVQSGESCCRAG